MHFYLFVQQFNCKVINENILHIRMKFSEISFLRSKKQKILMLNCCAKLL